MINYPRHVATKQDYVNLLSIPEYKEQALKDLQTIVNFADTAVRKSVGSDPNIEQYIEITNPNSLYIQKGFGTRQEIIDLINLYK